ncbi:hypothetical protein LBC_15890 [Campylobacter sp. 19-13652]|nr:hypothetical protein LBC_15890 [Campylobacter sp. 19-13652]
MAIVDAINDMRKKQGRSDFIIGYRFSPEEPGELGLSMSDSFALINELVKRPLQYLHVSLWDFYKKARRGADSTRARMELLHDRIGGRMPFIGVGNLYEADEILNAYETGWAEFIAIGKSVMLNPNLIELIKSGNESQIQRCFDWDRADSYRYTPAMLEGTRIGTDFYPPSKQYGIRYKSY